MSPMAVVLVGQIELWGNKLKLQRYAAIRQHINMCCILLLVIIRVRKSATAHEASNSLKCFILRDYEEKSVNNNLL